MLQISFQTDPEKFLATCGPFLRAREVEHNLILSICERLQKKIAAGEPAPAKCFSFMNEGAVVLAALQTPPHGLVLSRCAEGADVAALATALFEQETDFPGFVGPSDVSAAFANIWTARTGKAFSEFMDQIIYALEKVVPPPAVSGRFRLARQEEAASIAGWMQAFVKDVHLPKTEWKTDEQALSDATRRIADGAVAVWEDEGKIRAQAAFTSAGDIARVNAVYTPPEGRGRGYASAVVAHLSQHLLDHGTRLCCLYADARNPVSNSIYRKIGYEFVGRSSQYVMG